MKRRKFIYQTSLGLGGLLPVVKRLNGMSLQEGPYLATGIKVGEITDTEAVIWVRSTGQNKPVGKQAKIPVFTYLDEKDQQWHPVKYFKDKYKQDRPDRQCKVVFPEGYTVKNIEGAVPGIPAELRIAYKVKGKKNWQFTEWKQVDNRTDYSAQFALSHLKPGTPYSLRAETRAVGASDIGSFLDGQFSTAATASEIKSIHFMVTTCHEYDDQDDPDGGGFKIYKHMQLQQPDFLVHTGDVVYYDQKAKTLALAYWHWQRMFGLANCIDFYRQVPCYFMKDDHDTWMNDCYPHSKTRFMGDFTFEEGVKTFYEQVPMSKKPYRTFRWGKDLQIWLVEGREYRMDNTMEDGPGKTIWGEEQMKWFEESFAASDATYRILISPTPIVGPDRPQKRDNHANSGFAHEGAKIRNFMAGQKNAFIVCGDRHWQYVSKDSATGLMEFSCGPASNEHASGWSQKNVLPEHQYLNVVGGYLGVRIQRMDRVAQIMFTHYGVNGNQLFTKEFSTAV